MKSYTKPPITWKVLHLKHSVKYIIQLLFYSYNMVSKLGVYLNS